MAGNSELLRIQPDIVVNPRNIAFIELTGKGGADIHFVGKVKPLHLNTNEAEGLREYVTGDQVADISKAAWGHVLRATEWMWAKFARLPQPMATSFCLLWLAHGPKTHIG
jgi:hypothetical protein